MNWLEVINTIINFQGYTHAIQSSMLNIILYFSEHGLILFINY
jgi:hypothetical protein